MMMLSHKFKLALNKRFFFKIKTFFLRTKNREKHKLLENKGIFYGKRF